MAHLEVRGQEMEQAKAPKVWKKELIQYLMTKGQLDTLRTKVVSNRTMEGREQNLFLVFNELSELGYPIRTLKNFREKHVRALVASWEGRGLSASTLQNRLTHLRDLARHLDRSDMIGPTEKYVSDPRLAQRRTVAEEDQSWSAQGVDAQVLIDEVTGMQLRLMHAFLPLGKAQVWYRRVEVPGMPRWTPNLPARNGCWRSVV